VKPSGLLSSYLPCLAMTSTSCQPLSIAPWTGSVPGEQAAARRDQLARVGAIERHEHRPGVLGLWTASGTGPAA
jgi:hypothetical protein